MEIWASVASVASACALEVRAGELLAADPSDSRALIAWEKAIRAQTALSMRLRLSPQSRRTGGAKPASAPVSFYDEMRLEAGNGSDEA